jgi:protein HOOK3
VIFALQFIKSQDKLFKEEQTKLAGLTPVCFNCDQCCNVYRRFVQGTFEEAEASFHSQIKILEEEISRQKVRTL